VKGVLSIALEAKRRHRETLIVPVDHVAEAGGGFGSKELLCPANVGRKIACANEEGGRNCQGRSEAHCVRSHKEWGLSEGNFPLPKEAGERD
jgi:hypothetical protein